MGSRFSFFFDLELAVWFLDMLANYCAGMWLDTDMGIKLFGKRLGIQRRCGIIGLILRHVVSAWQFAPPCMTFCQLRRPRLRSVARPAGFDAEEPRTKEGNVLACFLGMALHLIDEFGQVSIL